jgi:hypothetical protein
MSNDITPSLKLSNAERRVALSRVLDKQQKQMPPQQQLGMGGGMPPATAMPSQPMPIMDGQGMQQQMPPIEMQGGAMPAEEPRMELSEVEKQIQSSVVADQLWKDSGGEGSIAEEVWRRLKKGSGVKHLDSPRDYFISSFIKYHNDPVAFKQKHPQEARLIKQLTEEFEASQVPETQIQMPMEGLGGQSQIA